MDKEEIQKKYEEAKVLQTDIKRSLQLATGLAARIKVSIAALEGELTEAEQPKLRHGDYGIYEDGPFFLWENHYLWTKEYEPGNNKCLSRSLNKTGNNSQLRVWASQIRGNIFDDLDALSVPLKEFNMDGLYGRMDTESIEISNSGGEMFYIAASTVNKFCIYLRRLVHTADEIKLDK